MLNHFNNFIKQRYQKHLIAHCCALNLYHTIKSSLSDKVNVYYIQVNVYYSFGLMHLIIISVTDTYKIKQY
jgi:hypothetical protein